MKVGKNNFKPPPQVESNVVRITPKVPRPQISYDEWDGLLRICFVRKNKTLRSSFLGTSTILDMLESNYRTWCAQNGIPVEEGPSESSHDDDMDVDPADEEDEWAGIVDGDDDEELPDFFKEEADRRAKDRSSQPKRKKKGKVAELVRAKILGVLETKTRLGEKRARMCDEGDFLKLLYEFNQEGLHFS